MVTYATDVNIYRGKHRATVEPLNEQVRKWILLNVNGVEGNGMYTINMDAVEDTAEMFANDGFVVEIK